jgi:hypothetical protein
MLPWTSLSLLSLRSPLGLPPCSWRVAGSVVVQFSPETSRRRVEDADKIQEPFGVNFDSEILARVGFICDDRL